jgi:hypothetical protein
MKMIEKPLKEEREPKEAGRILMRTLARELSLEEIAAVSGGLQAGTTSSKDCEPDDCDA